MTNKKGLHDMGPPIKDEIPGLMDFFASSVIGGAIDTTGFPENRDQWPEFCEVLADFAYEMAAAMYARKYKDNTRH